VFHLRKNKMKTMDKKGKNIKVSRIRAYKRYGI
jgi:hypothetical protein